MPQKRLRNIQRVRYGKLIDGVCPPLVEKEWETLKTLATDPLAWSGPVSQRHRGSGDEGREDTALDDRFLMIGPEKGETYEGLVRGRPHRLTRRYMQHIWQKLFRECCKMSWDPDKKSWKVEWGFEHLKEKEREFVYKTDFRYDAVLFEPVNSADVVPH
jgi:hypothetical protein